MDKYDVYTVKPDTPKDPEGISTYFLKIIEEMPNNVYWLDKNCMTLGCNRNVLNLIGLNSVEDFVGMTYEEMGKLAQWTEGQAESFKQDDMEVIRTGKPKLNIEEPPVYDKEGKPLYYMSSRVPLFDEHKNVIGVVGVSVDITERKMAEELTKKLLIEEGRTSVLKTLGGSIAHELTTPLAAAKFGVETLIKWFPKLLENYEKTSDQADFVIPQRQIQALKRLPARIIAPINSAFFIIDMLLVNINEYGIKRDDFGLISMNEVITEALEEYPFNINEEAFIHYYPTNSFDFLGNKILTKHVLFNLIKNSIYYIHDARKGEIIIKFSQNNKFNQLIFEDTGRGIASNLLPHIFDRFLSKRFGGTGLGLAFCKMVMDAYNGKIECLSEEGKYTKFILSFPKVK